MPPDAAGAVTSPLRWLAALPALLAFALTLAVVGIVSLAWNLVAWPLYYLLSPARGCRLGRAAIHYLYGIFFALSRALGLLRLDLGCLDALREERGLILVANHPASLDALLMASRLPRSACIMKAELMRNVFLGAGARLARYIRNDSPRGLVRAAVEDLRAGGQLIIFPEGTRTLQWPVNPFRPGVTLVAKLAPAPIQTVFIETSSGYLGKGWPLWRLPPLPLTISMRLGARFEPEADSDALLARLEAYYRREMRR